MVAAGYREHAPGNVAALLGISAPSVVVFAVLGAVKLHMGFATKSPSLKKDAACSLCGALLSLGVCIGTAVAHEAWWFDAVVALLVSGALLLHARRSDRERHREGRRLGRGRGRGGAGLWRRDGVRLAPPDSFGDAASAAPIASDCLGHSPPHDRHGVYTLVKNAQVGNMWWDVALTARVSMRLHAAG